MKMKKLMVKVWLVVAVALWSDVTSALWGSGFGDDAPIWAFQNARQKARAAQDIFHAQMTHARFGDAVMYVHDLLKQMHDINEREAQTIPEPTLNQAMSDAYAWQEMGLMRVKEERSQAHLDARYGLDRDSTLDAAAALRVQACERHLDIANTRQKLFAGQNLAQEYLDKRVGLLHQRHHNALLEILWNAFEASVEASAHGKEVLLKLRMLKKPLGDLLLKTKGDTRHPGWTVCAEPLNDIIQACFRSQDLASLLQNHMPVLAQSYGALLASDINKGAVRAFALFDDYKKSYDMVADFYWSMEKRLLDAAIDDAQRRVSQDQDSLYIALANVWSPNVSFATQRPRDLIMELLRGVMIRRFALTQLSWEKTQEPAPLS
ncbi:MAG: hypothetical protein C0514_01750 [Candidatus Puniceispirillum sp.]|nr:hypothetical protein [Candidatus Puniceispirillum sp.]